MILDIQITRAAWKKKESLNIFAIKNFPSDFSNEVFRFWIFGTKYTGKNGLQHTTYIHDFIM